MDPYRPNQYGFRPPPPPPSQAYGPPPTLTDQRFPPPGQQGIRPPPQFGAPHYNMISRPPPPSSTSSPVPSNPSPSSPTTDANNDKLTTLFVGAIAPGISDDWIIKLLETCGKLNHWKRTKDASGNPKGFGFATYGDPDSVLCALRVLGGEKTDGVTLKAMDGSGLEKKLIVKADDNVRNYLESYTNSKQTQESTTNADEQKYATVQKYVHAIATGQEPNDADAINKELAFFKERAIQKDQRSSSSSSSSSTNRPPTTTNDYRNRRDFHKGPTEYQQPQHDFVSDEELERRRKEKHDRDVENAYRQREKRFENRELNKLRDYERDLKRERDEEERELKDKEYWLARLANWDDELEMEKGEEIYYTDRSRWRKMRESIRRREAERDEEDRRREIHELEEEKIRLEQEERHKKESKFLNREADDGKIALKPRKLNFNLPIKRNTLGGGDEDDEEEAKKKRRVLVPLDYGDIDNVKTNYDEEEEDENLSAEERAKKVKELIGSIPSSQSDLWAYTIKWDELDQDLIESKLHPFVSKKIVDLLGMEEEDLVTFVLDFIRKRKGPDELVSELEGALDEDALVFVMKLWRALIFETERKARKL
ncbi:hypothetical protein BD770DRAFT_448242 [Pilaira anomala]|nr:hypothetical protein BD770DRAFT_448242 [Pilaira anomala]